MKEGYKSMGLLSKEQISELIKERNMKTTEDISTMLKDLFGETLQEMMEAEMDTTLGYSKNQSEEKQTANRRNRVSLSYISVQRERRFTVPGGWWQHVIINRMGCIPQSLLQKTK